MESHCHVLEQKEQCRSNERRNRPLCLAHSNQTDPIRRIARPACFLMDILPCKPENKTKMASNERYGNLEQEQRIQAAAAC